jgi:hypothetical protein
MPIATGKRPIYWMGRVGLCDKCRKPLGNRIIDGATENGPWGLFDPACHKEIGIGLGTGRGQAFEKQEDGRYLKVEG